MAYQNEIIMYQFQALFHAAFGKNLDKIEKLRADASERKIFRLSTDDNSCIGIYNNNVSENEAFICFSKAFYKSGFNVPEILGVNDDKTVYLESDLGGTTVFTYVKKETVRKNILKAYYDCLSGLLNFQFNGLKSIDIEQCYEGKEFDIELLENDINKFCEFCIKPHTVIDPAIIKNSEGMKDLIKEIMKTDMNYFMYRDFQPRNIMMYNGKLYFIDYQSGRKGPLQYDTASFLYSGSIDINEEEREQLLNVYINEMEIEYGYSGKQFQKSFYLFVMIRLIQVLGSYGYTYHNRKEENYLAKIEKALVNLDSIKDKIEIKSIRELIEVLTNK